MGEENSINIKYSPLVEPEGKVAEFIKLFNQRPISMATLSDVRSHCLSLRGEIQSQGRDPDIEEAQVLAACKSVEKWLLANMGRTGEEQL